MRAVTNKIIANLTAAGLLVGDGIKPPEDAGWVGAPDDSDYVPYVVVHSMMGGQADGTIHAPFTDNSPLYQLSIHGATRDQCELYAGRCHAVMTDVPLVPTGVHVALVEVDMLGGALRMDDVQPEIFQAAYRYRVHCTAI